MLPDRLLFKKGANRYTFILLLVFVTVSISFLTRLALTLYAARHFEWTFANVAGIFFIGFLYDLAVSAYIVTPFVIQLWFVNEGMYTSRWRYFVIGIYVLIIGLLLFNKLVPAEFNAGLHKAIIIYFVLRLLLFLLLLSRNASFRFKWRRYVLYAEFFLVVFLLLFNAISEWFFWNEFSVRYNFIAVDYLVYTNEVIGNIRESYPLGWIISGILLVTVFIVYITRKKVNFTLDDHLNIRQRTVPALLFLLCPLLAFFFLDNKWDKISNNEYVNELTANGLFEFGEAFNANELDFFNFYKVLPEKEAFSVVRKQLETPNSRLVSDDPFDIEREISYDEPEKKLNVVLISVESLSAEYMQSFGSDKNITPFLDSLSQRSLFFTSLYASGTRTVRGLEALTLSIPPTPGQSIVKRPGNENMFSIGSVFRSKGYTTQYIYGGYSYFDNMETFFSGNQYEVIDRTALKPEQVHYANIWGVADEDLFTLALQKLDENYHQQKPFFTHIMTVSNHRPFTYPEGRIDIPPSKQMREGAVKYTDYAIGKFIREAQQKPWFNNTIFVIVADHCAGSAGSVELPVTGYHIPLLIYSPANLPPQKIDRLVGQIDIAPTILGLLKFHYRSKFFGQDVFALPPGRERAFISTYQGLGYLREGQLVIQSPVRKTEMYKPDFTTGQAVKEPLVDSLVKQAIAYYETASWLVKHGKYRSN